MNPCRETLNKLEEEEEKHNYNIRSETITPVWKEQKNAICLVSSDKYTPFASLVLQSLICNMVNSQKYDIVILTEDMTISNQKILTDMTANYDNIFLRFYNVANITKDYNFYTWAHFTKNTYYRLLIPDLFEEYHNVLYVDADVIVNQDVSELLNINLDNYLMAAALDTHVVSYCQMPWRIDQLNYNKDILNLQKPDEYYQMGVVVFNCQKIRKEYGPLFLLKKAGELKLKWLDQDIINMFFQGKIKCLDNKWNVMIANDLPYCDEYYLPKKLRKEYYKARKKPAIIHYIGNMMPCFNPYPDMYTYFWKYARQSPCYEIILQRMSMNSAHRYYLSIKQRLELLVQYWPNILLYWRYKILSKITFGKKRKKYKEKRKKLKTLIKQTKQFLKGIK